MRFLARLVELEFIDRERQMIERRIKAARFPAVKSLDSFDFKAIPSLNKMQVLELARCEWIERRENVIALPRSTDLDELSEADIQKITMTINLTPRKCLAYRSPVEAFLSELGRDVEIRFV